MDSRSIPSSPADEVQSQMYFHTNIGDDILWFRLFKPSSILGTLAVCIGVGLLAIFERWLMAQRRVLGHFWNSPSEEEEDTRICPSRDQERDHRWRRLPTLSTFQPGIELLPSPMIYQQPFSPVLNNEPEDDQTPLQWPSPGSPIENIAPTYGGPVRDCRVDRHREGEPFRWRVDLARGGLQALQTAIHYLLMLVVMTYNVWWIASVLLGIGMGEVLFGRTGAS